jgi:hypothetical protein
MGTVSLDSQGRARAGRRNSAATRFVDRSTAPDRAVARATWQARDRKSDPRRQYRALTPSN